MANPRQFDIGIVQAGAISAGAYTAGVIDFLVEALDAWEERRAAAGQRTDGPVVPQHRVRLKVISGASAGAMTAAITAVALHSETEPVHWGFRAPAAERNRLYNAWVDRVGIHDMLTSRDLDGGRPVRSLLNARSLGGIARDALRTRPRPVPRDYVDDPLPVILTVSNLRGVPYGFGLYRNGHYIMRNHMDQMLFHVGHPDDPDAPGCLDVRRLGGGPLPLEWRRYADAALASGAFPIGLAARHLTRRGREYDPPEAVGLRQSPEWGEDVPNVYDFVAVDGGMMNNEPLALARQVLWDGVPSDAAAADNRCGLTTERALVLIDPFPNLAASEERYNGNGRLLAVVAQMCTALQNQARFHPEELALAARDDVFSRYAITPSRRDESGNMTTPAMCSAVLGGFGGFLSKDFRVFDFHLGRHNCQDFLARHFCLPEENPLFHQHLADEAAFDRQYADFFVRSPDGRLLRRPVGRPGAGAVAARPAAADDAMHRMLPIIPLMPRVAAPVALPPFPAGLTAAEWDDIERGIDARVSALGRAIIATELPHLVGEGRKAHLAAAALRLVWRLFLARLVRERVTRAVRAEVRVLH